MPDYPDHADTIAKRSVSFQITSGPHTGRRIEINSLTVGDFINAKEESFRQFKREFIRTYTENADLMPEDVRKQEIQEAFRKASLLTAHDLPQQTMSFPVQNGDGYKRDEEGNLVTQSVRVDYPNWWMSETLEGKMFMAWLSMRKSPSQRDISLDDVYEMFSPALSDLEEVANTAGELSQGRLAGQEDKKKDGKMSRRNRRRKNKQKETQNERSS